MFILDRLPYVLVMVLAALVCGFISVRAYKSRRKVSRASSFALMAFSGAMWMTFVSLDTIITNLALRQILWSLIPFAILNALTGLLFFSLEFCLRLNRVPKLVLYPVVSVVLIVTFLSVTNFLHHQMWTLSNINGIDIQVYGNLYPIQLFLTYILAFSSLVLLILAFFRSKGILRRQSVLLLTGILITLSVGIASDIFGWNPIPYLDEPAFSIVFAVLFFARATLRFDTFYLMPVASDVIIKNMQDGVLVTDIEGMILFTNPATQKIFGKKENQLTGHQVSKVLEEWLPEAAQAWEERKEEVQFVVGEPESHYYKGTLSLLVGYGTENVGHLLNLHDNTDQVNYEKKLNELAIRDPLTNSYNRRYFHEMAEAYFNFMQRTSQSLSILMMDLDHFKEINDTYGHAKGDLVLQKVANTCKKLIRMPDVFSRYGGEEFVLVMPDTRVKGALIVAERLRKAIEGLKVEVENIPVTASFGVVDSTGEEGLTVDLLIDRADEALYASKTAGRNRITAWQKH